MAKSESINLDVLQEDINEPIYFHVAWLKPGKITYAVESRIENKKKADFYLYQMLSSFRTERAAVHIDPSSQNIQEENPIQAIFETHRNEDGVNSYSQMLGVDLLRMNIEQVIGDKKQS